MACFGSGQEKERSDAGFHVTMTRKRLIKMILSQALLKMRWPMESARSYHDQVTLKPVWAVWLAKLVLPT